MKKFKEVLSKNNYLVAKIAGGVVAGVTAIIVIVAITAKDKEVAAEVRTTSHEEITTVEEEVGNLSNYIKLLQFAYEDDFVYQTNIDQELILYKIPTNIIQPIIENAFFHGINNITEQMGRINLEIFKEKECVIIEVLDNGNKETANRVYRFHEGAVQTADSRPARIA